MNLLKQCKYKLCVNNLFFKVHFIDYAITVVPFFLPFIPLYLQPFSHQHSNPTPQFMFMGHTYKFFGFFISYTILNLPLSTLYLQFLLLIPCTFSLFCPLPTDNPPCYLHFCDSVPVVVVCFACFLGSVVDSCESVVILLFIFFDLLFLR